MQLFFYKFFLYDTREACEIPGNESGSPKHQEWPDENRVRQPGLEKPRCLGCWSGSSAPATDVRTIVSEQNFSGKSSGGPGISQVLMR